MCETENTYKTSSYCKEDLRRYRKALRRAKIDTIQQYKQRPCADCGVEYPHYVMDFDHVRGEKRFNISQGYSDHRWAEIVDEIHKCDLVCANCHRMRTAKSGVRDRDEEDLTEFAELWDYEIGEMI